MQGKGMEQNGTGLQEATRKKKVPGRLRENFMCFHISQHCSEGYSPEPSLLRPSSHYCQICSLTSPSFSQHGGEGVSAALLSALKRKKKRSNCLTHFHSFISKEYSFEAGISDNCVFNTADL